MNKNNENIKLEPLGKGIKIYIDNIHKFTTDTILLANFSNAEKAKTAVDLGTGCGAIPLLWSKNQLPERIDAVELQESAVNLLTQSVNFNNLQERINPVHADLRSLKGVLPFGFYDLVVCNPPYKHSGSGVVNPEEQKHLARHETACTLREVVKAAAGLLQFGGRFCVCQRAERLTDVLVEMRRSNLEPKRIRLVQHRKNKPPKLVLVEGKRGGKPGFLQVEPTLFIEDECGCFSEEMLRIYGDYKNQTHE